MRIYIPTRGRIDKQKTVERLGSDLCREFNVTIVCPPDEVAALKKAVSEPVKVLACGVEGIAATRQWILDHARKNGEHVILMLDDDLPTWRQRTDTQNEKGETPYRKATTEEIGAGLRQFDSLMESYAHGSIGHALFCQTQPLVKKNSRMLRALAYNMKLLPKDIKFRLQVMEDFDIALQLFTRGYESVTFNGVVQDQHQNNSEGGCSSYRTNDVQAAAAHKLHELWPQFVTVVTRSPKREWIGMPDRTDVRVNWAAAISHGLKGNKK